MIQVPVEIVRWVDDCQPGIVECVLVDVHGHRWRFIEKLPIVTVADLDASSSYPQSGSIACQVVEIRGEVARIDTTKPWGVESVDGVSQFEVLEETLFND